MEDTPIQIKTENTIESFACPKCGKEFASENSLRMHKMRVHTRAGKLGPMWKKSESSKIEKELAKRRDWQSRLRANNIKKGLTSSGKPRQRPLRKNYRGLERVDQNDLAYIRREARSNYNRNWYNKNKGKKKIQIVYPDLTIPIGESEKEKGEIKYCPYCGNNIAKLVISK